MHKPGILIQIVYKPDVIINVTFNGIILIQYISFRDAHKYGVDATTNYYIYITIIIHIHDLNSLANP